MNDTMLDLLEPFTEGLKEYDASSSTSKAKKNPKQITKEKNLLMTNLPRLSPVRGEILGEKQQRVRKESSVPNQEEITMCSFVIRNIPIVKCKKTKIT